MTAPSARSNRWLAPALLVCATFAVYGRTVTYPFVFDDTMFIASNAFVHSTANIPRFFTEPVWSGVVIAQQNYYRPAFLLWVLANYSVFGNHAAGWHLGSLALHCFNVVLVYLLALRLAGDCWAAGAGAALFSLHPLQAESVSWVCCSNDLLACFFVLLSLLSYLRARESRGSQAMAWWAISLASYAAGTLSKEPAILLPLVIVLHEFLGRPAARKESAAVQTVPANLALATYFAIAIAYFLLRRSALGNFLGTNTPVIGRREELFTLPSVLFTYVGHLFWPVNLSAFYDVPYHTSFGWPGVILPALVLLAVLAAAGWAVARSAAAQFSFAWTIIFLAPALHIAAFPRGELVHDRFLYVPMAGVGLLAAAGFAAGTRHTGVMDESHERGHRTVRWAAATLLAALALVCWRQTGFWSNNYELFRRGVAIAPQNGIATGNLGIEYVKAGDRETAAVLLRRADALNPDIWEAGKQQGYAHLVAGRYKEAEQALEVAEITRPNDGLCHFLLGLTYLKTGRPAQAVEEARRAVTLAPQEAGLHYGLATILEATGDLAGAREEYRAELAIRPDHQPSIEKLHELDKRLGTPAPSPGR